MTDTIPETQEPENTAPAEPEELGTQPSEEFTPETVQEDQKDERRRRLLLLVLLLLLLLCCCVGYFIVRYLRKPQPLPEMLPAPISQNINYPPTYKFMITGVDKPVGVAHSPDDQRIYVAEAGGLRLIKIFDRAGNLLKSFAPPGTDPANREPKYIAVSPDGRVFLAERTSNAIDIFDPDGNFLDAIIDQDMTLTKYLAQNLEGGVPQGTVITHFEGINRVLNFKEPGQDEQQISIPPVSHPWAPLGIRFDSKGDLIYTDISTDQHSVHVIPAAALNGPLNEFNPQIVSFGVSGTNKDQLNFPQVAVEDSKGNLLVSDSNNTRISIWTPDLKYKVFFGVGSNDQSLNLPRGMWIDQKDHLHVADAVGSVIRVYDVSGNEPAFLYNFGEYGIAEGQFNFPIDITMDGTGRLYIADRENNRIQVWSY